ncbi:MAG: hypothetical protein HY305_07030 [Sphingobacteriales bacterium]|nr:hypothetical protein [Sphingobacteriales bacterium]
MKKIVIVACMVVSFIATAIAQQKTPKSIKEGKAKTAKAVDSTTKKANSTTAKLKADGTLDMRYKENKEAKIAGPKKADGTADMRYKANKK